MAVDTNSALAHGFPWQEYPQLESRRPRVAIRRRIPTKTAWCATKPLTQGLNNDDFVWKPGGHVENRNHVSEHFEDIERLVAGPQWSTAGALLKFIGTWVGDDIDECFELVLNSRSRMQWQEYDFQQLGRFYSLRESQQIIEELKEFPFLVPLLLEAHGSIQEHFPDSPCFLEIFRDPESENERGLALYIGVSLTPDGSLEQLRQFDKDWWREASVRAGGLLCIDLEYL